MNALLSTVSAAWGNLTDKQKMMITFITLGVPIDRTGRTGFWAAGRRFIFNDRGECVRTLDYTTDGRISHSARIACAE